MRLQVPAKSPTGLYVYESQSSHCVTCGYSLVVKICHKNMLVIMYSCDIARSSDSVSSSTQSSMLRCGLFDKEKGWWLYITVSCCIDHSTALLGRGYMYRYVRIVVCLAGVQDFLKEKKDRDSGISPSTNTDNANVGELSLHAICSYFVNCVLWNQQPGFLCSLITIFVYLSISS